MASECVVHVNSGARRNPYIAVKRVCSPLLGPLMRPQMQPYRENNLLFGLQNCAYAAWRLILVENWSADSLTWRYNLRWRPMQTDFPVLCETRTFVQFQTLNPLCMVALTDGDDSGADEPPPLITADLSDADSSDSSPRATPARPAGNPPASKGAQASVSPAPCCGFRV